MHCIHCFLVKLPEEIISRLYGSHTGSKKVSAIEEAKSASESEVITVLEHYENRVYDWYTTPGDFEWDRKDVPGYVLGYEEPDKLLELLTKYSSKPLELAKSYLRWFKDETKVDKVEITEETLDRIWNPDYGALNPFYLFSIAMKLAFQDYISESFFYSCPDGSTKISEGIWGEVRKNAGAFVLVFVDIHC
jgi:hypothetical protein